MKLKSKKPTDEIPTSSMADIAFLLIIFFMVTAVFASTKGLELKLPKEDDNNAPPETEESVFIKIEPNGAITVDCRPMQVDDILDYLAPKLSRDAEKPVVLYSDPYAPYQAMIRVYDQLMRVQEDDPDDPNDEFDQLRQRLGFDKVRNISIPTQTEVNEYIQAFGVNPFETHCSGG